MAAQQPHISALTRELSLQEDWQDLVAWDGDELFDPIFHGNANESITTQCSEISQTSYAAPDLVLPDYVPSVPTSIVDGPCSFEYTPPVIDGPGSSGQAYSFLGTSPTFAASAAASPCIGSNDWGQYGSFNASDHGSFYTGNVMESPIIDVSEQILPVNGRSNNPLSSISTDLFNPFVSGSLHTFNSLDVNASQVLATPRDWPQEPQNVEPILEEENAQGLVIPQAMPSGHLESMLSQQARASGSHDQPRGITIPQPSRGPASYNPISHILRRGHRDTPTLSVSPDARRPRSRTLSRSTSRIDHRMGKNSLATPSPTAAKSSSFSWVAYQHDRQNNKLIPHGSEGKRQKGRTRALTLQQRSDAALMRVLKACSNCRRRKEKCDPGVPCKACLNHYKGDLVNHPCRERILSDLSTTFLSDRLGWHPTARSLQSTTSNTGAEVFHGIEYTIPLVLGFGPTLYLSVHPVQVPTSICISHIHTVYSWPPSESKAGLHTHAVLPATLTSDACSRLPETLDAHLSLLVAHHFRSFPLYCSPLRILRDIYVFYSSLPPDNSSSRLLHQALKLLVLVHIGGDLALPAISTDATLIQLVKTSMPSLGIVNEKTVPAPCIIRAQFGSIMPGLAMNLMKEVLAGLERLCLDRGTDTWPHALAVLLVLVMTIESIHYHAAKLPYHHAQDANTLRLPDLNSAAQARRVDDEGVEYLFKFYSACFLGSHARLRHDWSGDQAVGSGAAAMSSRPISAEDRFIEGIRGAVKRANVDGYLKKKAIAERQSELDMGFFFDRLVARLLVLET